MAMTIAGDVAHVATAGSLRLHCCDHRIEHRRVLIHARIVVGLSGYNLAADALIEGSRKAATVPLEVCPRCEARRGHVQRRSHNPPMHSPCNTAPDRLTNRCSSKKAAGPL